VQAGGRGYVIKTMTPTKRAGARRLTAVLEDVARRGGWSEVGGVELAPGANLVQRLEVHPIASSSSVLVQL